MTDAPLRPPGRPASGPRDDPSPASVEAALADLRAQIEAAGLRRRPPAAEPPAVELERRPDPGDAAPDAALEPLPLDLSESKGPSALALGGLMAGAAVGGGLAALAFAGALGFLASPGAIETRMDALGRDAARAAAAAEEARSAAGAAEARIQALEDVGPAAARSDVEALGRRLDETAATVAGLAETAGRLDRETLKSGALDLIEDRVVAIERLAPERTAALARGAALAALSDRFRAAAAAGRPFAAELAGLIGVLPGEAALNALAPYAAAGVPTAPALAADLERRVPDLLAAALAARPWRDWRDAWDAVRPFLLARIGVAPGGPGASAGLARALARARAGDLAAALAEIALLPPDLREAARPWTDAATGRMLLDSAARTVETRALDRLGVVAP